MSILSIDFGGTRTRAAWFVADSESNLRRLKRSETPSRVDQPAQAVIDRMIALCREVVPEGVMPAAIGICAPGPLDAQHGVIYHAETLPGWQNVPLARIISGAFGGKPVFMQNDGNLAALAEYQGGALHGANPGIFMTLSTGIGGGAVLDGKLFSGANGLAIEPGHMVFRLPDGKVYRLEDLASGTALGRWARRKLAESDAPSLLREAFTVDGQAVGAAAEAGDALALEVVAQAGYWLGLGFANLLHLFNPQAIALAGSVTRLGDLLLDPARQTLVANLLDPGFYHDDLIRYARLGDDVCLTGAALYAVQRLATG
jgi:glucokinase